LNKNKNKIKDKIKFKFKSRFIQYIYKVLCWMRRIYFLKGDIKPSLLTSHQLFLPLLTKMDNVLYARGPKNLIIYIKEVRRLYLNYLSGSPSTSKVVKITNDGIPVILGNLIPILRIQDTSSYICTTQVLTTILWGTRSLKTKNPMDTKPIETPGLPNIKEVAFQYGKYSKDFWSSLGYYKRNTVPKSLKFKKFHSTTKSGPNGHALWACLSDLISLPDDLFSDIGIVGGELLANKMSNLREATLKGRFKGILPDSKGDYRKLSRVDDKEHKTRVIAILDYFSQTSLKPLHDYLFQVLKKIPQDRTFIHGDFQYLIANSNSFYSVDLTSATDRFPIELIKNVLKGQLPDYYVNAWSNIMIGHPFSVPKQRLKISYAVGNPMGAYSSWASFAVVHHYVVYYCCRELNIEWKTLPYCLLGDDIVIGNSIVAELYINVIRNLGVEVSDLKTHKSTEFFEFAKRMFYKNQEITPFPISALKESAKRYYRLVNLLMEQEKRDYISQSIPASVSSFYEFINIKPSKFRKEIYDKSEIVEYITKVMRDPSSGELWLNHIIQSRGYLIRKLNYNECLSIFSNLAVELFSESNPENLDDSKELGQMAISLTTYLSSLEDDESVDLRFKLIDSLPQLSIYGQVEEMFLRIKNEAFTIDTVRAGDWPLLLRAMMLPSSDQQFSMRTRDLSLVASSVISKKLIERLNFLQTETGRIMLG
jgi:hypothetical protein